MKALVAIADGSEEIELTTIADVLVRAGVSVELASVSHSLIIKGSRGIQIAADKLIEECKDVTYDLIALPGGMPGAENLRDCPTLISMLKDQAASKRYYAAICASPSVVLDTHKLLAGKKATCYPCFNFKSGIVEKEPVVVSDNLITSMGPGTAMSFALKLVELLKGKKVADKIGQDLLVN